MISAFPLNRSVSPTPGKAEIIIEPALCESFAIQNKPASSVLKVEVSKVYFQCQKAIARSQLWSKESQIDRTKLPTAGEMAAYFSELRGESFDGKSYDENYPAHLKKTIY